MSSNSQLPVPSSLSALERAFARWRRKRRRGARIPGALWAGAVSAARAHGAAEVAALLNLDLGRLRSRLGGSEERSLSSGSLPRSSGFVSVVSGTDTLCSPAGSVSVEVERPDGSRLLIRQVGADGQGAIDVAELVSAFTEGR